MNVPNVLTCLRIVMTGFFIYALLQDTVASAWMALILFALASITDFFDGYLARRYNLITDFGKIMDPIADKLLILSAFYLFSHMNFISAWMFWLMFAREAGITVYRFFAMSRKRILAAESMGKFKTVAQIFTILFILGVIIYRRHVFAGTAVYQDPWQTFYWPVQLLMIITVAITLLSGFQFWINNRKLSS